MRGSKENKSSKKIITLMAIIIVGLSYLSFSAIHQKNKFKENIFEDLNFIRGEINRDELRKVYFSKVLRYYSKMLEFEATLTPYKNKSINSFPTSLKRLDEEISDYNSKEINKRDYRVKRDENGEVREQFDDLVKYFEEVETNRKELMEMANNNSSYEDMYKKGTDLSASISQMGVTIDNLIKLQEDTYLTIYSPEIKSDYSLKNIIKFSDK